MELRSARHVRGRESNLPPGHFVAAYVHYESLEMVETLRGNKEPVQTDQPPLVAGKWRSMTMATHSVSSDGASSRLASHIPRRSSFAPQSATTVRAHYQPIVSIRTGATWALEALARGEDPVSGETLAPLAMFAAAERKGCLAELDRECRRAALAGFVEGASSETILSINWDVRGLADAEADPGQFLRDALAVGLPPSRIAIEILEQRAADVSALAAFVAMRRAEGFLIAVDDCGTGHSSTERVVLLEPDVIKLDRSLVHGIARSIPRREACRSLAEMARSIGAIVVAEGIEREEDLEEIALLGIELVQGFLLARPGPDVSSTIGVAEAAVRARRNAIEARAVASLRARRATRRAHDAVVAALATALSGIALAEVEQRMRLELAARRDLEAVYALDPTGTQFTPTLLSAGAHSKAGFRPTAQGANLALKDYFLEVVHGEGTYVSRPYVSMASGRRCITHARRIELADDAWMVLCCDLPEGSESA